MKEENGEILEVSHVNNFYYDNGLGILSKRKKKQVLHDVSFTIHKDEFFGLVGESGCGKSTLGNAILNLIPFEGSIRVAGAEASATDRKTFTSRVQAVFQDPMSALNPRKTIGFTLREPLRAHGIGTPGEQTEAMNRMLERIGLNASYADRYPRELSGGQRQRVCIGAALMLKPELVIADEAVSALDVSVGAQILNLFRDIDAQRDFAMLFISHNLNVVYYLCDRIAVMYRGRIVELGTADEIYRNPQHPYTKLLLAAIPDWNSRIEDDGTKTLEELEQEDAKLETVREDVPEACCFYHRCPNACEKCRKCPETVNVAPEEEEAHLVSCFLQQKKSQPKCYAEDSDTGKTKDTAAESERS